MPSVAVIVPAFNAATSLGFCLDSLVAQDRPASLKMDLIVVDDGSLDATAKLVADYAGDMVRLIRTPHRGAAAARNAGVRATRPDCSIVLFTDADCVPARDWVCQMVAALEKVGPEIAGIKGAYRTRQPQPVARFVQAEFDLRYHRFQKQKIDPDFADTYAAAFRRDLLLQHPFDETLPGAIVEDAELGWRMRQAGFAFKFEPQAVVYHQHSASARIYFRRKFRIGRWRAIIYRRYLNHLTSESHTTPAAKLQLLLFLAGTAGPLLGLGLQRTGRFKRSGWTLAALGGLAFGSLQASFWPFYRQSRLPARLVWPLLNLRTSALGTGAMIGVLQLGWQSLTDRVVRRSGLPITSQLPTSPQPNLKNRLIVAVEDNRS